MNKGFSLDIQGKNIPTFKQEDELYAGDTISFKMGQDVEWVKNVVSEKTGLSRSDFRLFFDSKQMLEILSLSDIPNLKDKCTVQVVVNDGVVTNFDHIQ